MMPALVNEAAPVPPPAYHCAQARLGPALHIDALTLVNTLHLLTLCRLPCVWLITDALPLCQPDPVARLGPTVKSPCSLSRSCARCGGFRIGLSNELDKAEGRFTG